MSEDEGWDFNRGSVRPRPFPQVQLKISKDQLIAVFVPHKMPLVYL